MATYKVTETVTRTIDVEADDMDTAETQGLAQNREDWRASQVSHSVERIHTEFEYRVRVEADDDYRDIDDLISYYDSEAERQEAIDAIKTYGVYGFVAERRALDTEDGKPGEWEHVDSCWGFAGFTPEGLEAAIREHLSEEFKDCDFE